ncbi:SurA N-terminal domain-containing protein [Virgibacillus byunsanensis]|uniref:peptidylprolyl isomerase n=1 Tax=Virgibacillus byunsanensis TaxID=570945 RepID=A0ABW3LJJ5_9BACI
MKKIIMLLLAISLATILAACGGDDESAEEGNGNEDIEQPEEGEAPAEQVEISDEEKVSEDEVVVNVNGNDILGDKYNATYGQTKVLMSQNGQDISNVDQLKEQTINVLVEQHLIKQEAEEKGIEVTEDEVDSEIETIKSENGEQFTAVLEQYHLTEESYKDQLMFELTLNKYMEEEFSDIEVTDKEVQEYYDQAAEQQGEGLPAFKEVEGQLKQRLAQQKEQQQLMSKVEELKESAEIEKLI